ncbi:hypothetical protein GS501_02345 [Saccharibacter sp. 17.LH.SD]|uniref:hypothetical protein n=1 Tax=Saccharibacter sp. 17.LH.SD TaxID=2689393 RepID=UPI001368E9E1|nr:hypothetical protein [Saccharibacter sp. 17.LH.SD]MXV43892.1 hypothetical protein [Saccharibacter sp. 17.LH.SD]
MASVIVEMNGVSVNIGDPSDSDPIYLSGERQLFSDAQAEMASFGRLGLQDFRNRGGPQTQAYLDRIETLANSRIIYGHWPKVPARVED